MTSPSTTHPATPVPLSSTSSTGTTAASPSHSGAPAAAAQAFWHIPAWHWPGVNPTTVAVAAWILGFLLVPLMVLVMGWVASKRRLALEGSLRSPRPAVDLPASTDPMSAIEPIAAIHERKGFATGMAIRARDAGNIPRILARDFGLNARLEMAGDSEPRCQVTLWGHERSGAKPVLGVPACAFDRGLLAGLFTRLIGTPIEVYESACTANGAPACVFEVVPRREPGVQVAEPSLRPEVVAHTSGDTSHAALLASDPIS
ncbi:MAG: V4R domain-containing protein [Thermoplasmatota archaeon]